MAHGVRWLVLLLGLLLPAASSHPEAFAPDRWASECAGRALGAGRAEAADGGCCHFGGGVCGCRAGRAVCCKGGVSSCPCGGSVRQEPPPATRGVPRGDEREGPVVHLSKVLFTDQDSKPPLLNLTSFRMGQNVWVWVDLRCPEACRAQLASFGESEIPLSLYWYFDPGASPVLREDLKTDRAFKASALPLRVVIPARLTPGNWIAEIAYGPDRICTWDDQRCSFRVRMIP